MKSRQPRIGGNLQFGNHDRENPVAESAGLRRHFALRFEISGTLRIFRQFPSGAFAALVSAALSYASFPPLEMGWAAWIALIPLLWTSIGSGGKHGFMLGWLFGFALYLAHFALLHSLPEFRVYHALLLASFYALFSGAAGFALGRLDRASHFLPLHAAAIWIVCDFARDHAGFMALPWPHLGATQTANLPVLQLAQFGGVYLIGFVMVVCAALLYQALSQRKAHHGAVAVLLMMSAHGAGWVSMSMGAMGDTPAARLAVGIVQPNILPHARDTSTGDRAAQDRIAQLHARLAADKPDVVVWPESAMRGLSEGTHSVQRVAGFVARHGVPVLTGAAEGEKFVDAENKIRRQEYNSAYWASNDRGDWPNYRKLRLFPFGEYQPLSQWVDWPSWLVPKVFDFVPGQDRVMFDFPRGVRAGVLICWESLFARDARDAVQGGARLLAVLSNDAWFRSETISRLHNLAAILRAVEMQTPVIVASNTGPSLLIDGHGRVLESSAFEQPGTLSAGLSIPVKASVYAAIGDVFAWACIAWVLVLICAAACGRKKSGQVATPRVIDRMARSGWPSAISDSSSTVRG